MPGNGTAISLLSSPPPVKETRPISAAVFARKEIAGPEWLNLDKMAQAGARPAGWVGPLTKERIHGRGSLWIGARDEGGKLLNQPKCQTLLASHGSSEAWRGRLISEPWKSSIQHLSMMHGLPKNVSLALKD